MVLIFIAMNITVCKHPIDNMVQLFHHFIKITVSSHDHLFTRSLHFASTFNGIEFPVSTTNIPSSEMLLLLKKHQSYKLSR